MRTLCFLSLLLAVLGGTTRTAAQQPVLRRVYFNLYTDSLKPILNYYVNVEGEYSDGSYRPLDSTTVRLTADRGVLRGNEWLVPATPIAYDRVTFSVVARQNPALRDTVTVWIKKWKDPQDAPDYYGPADEKYGTPRRAGR